MITAGLDGTAQAERHFPWQQSDDDPFATAAASAASTAAAPINGPQFAVLE